MRFLYGVLGIVARANERMSRFSVNFIPSNWIVMGFCALMFALCLGWSRDALTSSKVPHVFEAEVSAQNIAQLRGA